MKVVLFCGGLGTRLKEYSETIPKPLVPIGYRPIIWHLMKYYSYYGHKDFVLCLGYRGDLIKEYFLKYNECLSNDFTLSQGGKNVDLVSSDIDDWSISFVDTGINANIGQRLCLVKEYLKDEEIFLANYSDGLTDLPLNRQIEEFNKLGSVANFAGVRPSQSFHSVQVRDDGIVSEIEHVRRSDVWINGGFFILRSEIFDYIKYGEELVEEPFNRLISLSKLSCFKYDGFWGAMDTFKDKKSFDAMYDSGDTPWTVWNRR